MCAINAMTDREFLAWIHARLQHVHYENPHTDYMHTLRAIVLATPPGKRSTESGRKKNESERLAQIR
jgi:hypothetical protein